MTRLALLLAVALLLPTPRSAPVIPAAALTDQSDQGQSGAPDADTNGEAAGERAGSTSGPVTVGAPLPRGKEQAGLIPGPSGSGGEAAPAAASLTKSDSISSELAPAAASLIQRNAGFPAYGPTAGGHMQGNVATCSNPCFVDLGRYAWRHVLASSYGFSDGYFGGPLACGGRLDATTLVVAHRTLPCGTRVELTFWRGHRSWTVVAVVRDRGPFVAGRVFDLGPKVARDLHFSGLGYVEWRLAP